MRTSTPASSRFAFHTRILLAASLLVAIVAQGGCSRRRASYTPIQMHAAPARSLETVEVLLDHQPERPFRVVGELHGRGLESPTTIEQMRDEAARAGLDGIYWIDCAPGSGRCTAKGFVYAPADAPADAPRPPIPGGSDSVAVRAAQ